MTSILVAVWNVAVPLNGTHCHFDAPTGQILESSPDVAYIGGIDHFGQPLGNFWFQNGGWFHLHLKASLMPSSGVSSFTWTKIHPAPVGGYDFITPFEAKPTYTQHEGSIIFKADPQSGYRLTYHAPTGAVINPDPRASKLTIYKLGAP